jgi:hypothetical protein
MAPIAEVRGSKPTQLHGDLAVSIVEGKTLLFPTTKQAADALNDIKTQHPKTKVTLKDGDDFYELTLQGTRILAVTLETNRTRVIDPVAE